MITIANWIANLFILGLTAIVWLIAAFLVMLVVAGVMHLVEMYRR